MVIFVRLVSFTLNHESRFGIATEEGVIDLTHRTNFDSLGFKGIPKITRAIDFENSFGVVEWRY